jgi:hypothetical protein
MSDDFFNSRLGRFVTKRNKWLAHNQPRPQLKLIRQLDATTFRITTIPRMTFNRKQNVTLISTLPYPLAMSGNLFNVILPSVILTNAILFCHSAEYKYAQSHSGACQYDLCHSVACHHAQINYV